MELEIFKLKDNTPITKEVIKQQAETLKEQVTLGNIDPEIVYAFGEYLNKLGDEIKEKTKNEMLGKIPEKVGLTVKGMLFKRAEKGVKYDYSKTQLWCELDAKREAIKKDMDELQAILKKTTKKTEQIDGDEVITLYPPIKTSTTTIETKFGK